MSRLKPLLPLIALLFQSGVTLGQTDDFDDGDDTGWTRQDSLGLITGSSFASFDFVDGGYRISAAESPSPAFYGPSRAASLRQDVSYTGQLFISVDLKIGDPTIKQAVGMLAFVQPATGPGITSGYSLSFQPESGDIVLNRIVNEVPIRLADADLTGVAGNSLRLVFIAEDGLLTGAVYNLDDLLNPIAKVEVSDTVYSSGTAGVFVFADTDDASGVVDAVFDNYRANPLSLPDLTLTLLENDDFQLTWPDWAVHFSPSSSPDLSPASWGTIPAFKLETGVGVLSHTGKRAMHPKYFFRLERRPL